MKSRESYEKKIRKKITKIFKKTIKRKYKQETKRGKVTSFTYKEIEIESAHGKLYLFGIHKDLLLDCFIQALKELSNKYTLYYNSSTGYFTMERKDK